MTASPNAADGLRSEFKEAMDAYEAFYIEYVDVFQRVKAGSMDFVLLAKYAELMGQAAEVDRTFEAWDGNMNDKETAYYAQVSMRVMQMLASIAE